MSVAIWGVGPAEMTAAYGCDAPRTLTPGAGQRWMTIFTLAAFEPGTSLTFRTYSTRA